MGQQPVAITLPANPVAGQSYTFIHDGQHWNEISGNGGINGSVVGIGVAGPLGGPVPYFGPATPPWAMQPNTLPHQKLFNLILQRLNPNDHANYMPFEYGYVHCVSKDKYIVFLVHNEQPLVIEDGDLFPSDALITKLRLLLG